MQVFQSENKVFRNQWLPAILIKDLLNVNWYELKELLKLENIIVYS